MAPHDTDSQFRFLISCIRNSANGKVDFEKVAAECEVVSKGAAAKRYERLMKQHGITTGASAVKKEAGASKAPAKGRASKKRKLAKAEDDDADVDELVKEEDLKQEVKGEVKTEDAINVKLECHPDTATTNAVFAPSSEIASAADDRQSATPTDPAAAEDDDEVVVVSATERSLPDALSFGHQHHHHLSHSHHSHSIPGIHSFDLATNLGFPQQTRTTSTMTPTMMTQSNLAAYPYDYTSSQHPHLGNPWHYADPNSHGFL
ncbi:hypothetical protein F4780DRAFT_234352 [Xylariomycetidae sp. FL0641]|nr:hypothetical protein F4780DRAFT_234352 [Xylariomycetidae sp. FL0641]